MSRLSNEHVTLDLSSAAVGEITTDQDKSSSSTKPLLTGKVLSNVNEQRKGEQRNEEISDGSTETLLPTYRAYPTLVRGYEYENGWGPQEFQDWVEQETNTSNGRNDIESNEEYEEESDNENMGHYWISGIRKVRKYRLSLSGFTTPGYYSAVWSITIPPDRVLITNFMAGRIIIKDKKNGRVELLGNWQHENYEKEEGEQVKRSRVVQLRQGGKIWLEEGFQVMAEIRLNFNRTKESKAAKAGKEIVEEVWEDGIDIARKRKSGKISLFELRPYEVSDSMPTSTIDTLDVATTLAPRLIGENNTKDMYLGSNISDDQKHFVILTRSGKQMYLNEWDFGNGDLANSRRPIASTIFTVTNVSERDDAKGHGMQKTFEEAGKREIDLSLGRVGTSFDGQFVVVFGAPGFECSLPVKNDGARFTVRLFQRVSGPKEKNRHVGLREKSTKTGFLVDECAFMGFKELAYDPILPLANFAGFAKFQPRFFSKSQSSVELNEPVLVTCDGQCIDVYQVQSKVKLLHSVSLALLLPPKRMSRFACQHLMRTLHMTMFAWNQDEEQDISIWNWRTGRYVGSYPAALRAILSTDEKTLIAIKGPRTCAYLITDEILVSSKSVGFGISAEQGIIQGASGQLTILHTGGFKEDRGTIREMNMQNTNVTREIVFRKPLGSTLLHFLHHPMTLLSRGTVITQNDGIFTLLNVMADDTTSGHISACTSTCNEGWPGRSQKNSILRDDIRHFIYRLTQDWDKSVLRCISTSTYVGGETQRTILVELPLDPRSRERSIFVPQMERFLVIRANNWELWELPTKVHLGCSLLTVGTKYYLDTICIHGNILQRHKAGDTTIFDTSSNDFLHRRDTIEAMRLITRVTKDFDKLASTYQNSIVEFITHHINKDPGYDEELSRFDENHLQFLPRCSDSFGAPLDKTKTSVMWTAVLQCRMTGNDSFLRAILESRCEEYWIPQKSDFSTDPEKDIIAYLIAEFKVPIAWLLIDYCIARAHSTDPVFFDLLMISVPHLLHKHPDIALEISRRGAFIPAQRREDLLQRAVINNKHWAGKFWETKKTNLFEVIDDNPTFHRLNRLPITKGQAKLQVAMSPDTEEVSKRNADIKSNLFVVPVSLAWSIQSRKSIDSQKPPIWILVLRMLKHFVYPLDTVYVHSIYPHPEVCDNPAVEALMNYKWNRFARYFWAVRLFFQITYEFLVLAVTLVQIYGAGGEASPVNLQAGYVAIIILGYMLLHLEFQQVRAGYHEYFSSPYNYVDVSVYTIPMIASAILLVHPENTDALRALSFAIVLIYLHFIFDLRVFKNVHKVVTIVVNILLAIPAFFVILAIFILSFAHSINHLTYRSGECLPNGDGSVPTCQTLRDEFPFSYLQSVSATYFFMTGDYGPVATSLTDGHWTSQLMVGFFFFLTAVLMMNVVIALMNGVYSDAVTQGEFIWLKNRLDLIAGAENLTFYLPYFRDHFDYFPRFIYYTATDKQVKDYREKYELDKKPLQFDFSTKVIEKAVDDDSASSTAMIQVASAAASEAASNFIETKSLLAVLQSKLETMETKLETERKAMEAKWASQEVKHRELLEQRDQRFEEMFKLMMNQVSSSLPVIKMGHPGTVSNEE